MKEAATSPQFLMVTARMSNPLAPLIQVTIPSNKFSTSEISFALFQKIDFKTINFL